MPLSIGNDIVDLQIIDIARTRLPNFYSKILAESEKQLYKSFEYKLSFEVFVWLLWSVKESVYKNLKRYQPQLVFTPVKIILTELILPAAEDKSGLPIILIEQKGFEEQKIYKSAMAFENQLYYAKSLITSDFIHTVAASQEPGVDCYWGVKKINDTSPENQSAAVRAFALNRLHPLFPGNDLKINKSDVGYPFVEQNGAETDIPLSFSHHGEYVAYAFEPTN
jgi:phosphopantetheinyl transferase (holo-ACP synthase)